MENINHDCNNSNINGSGIIQDTVLTADVTAITPSAMVAFTPYVLWIKQDSTPRTINLTGFVVETGEAMNTTASKWSCFTCMYDGSAYNLSIKNINES